MDNINVEAYLKDKYGFVDNIQDTDFKNIIAYIGFVDKILSMSVCRFVWFIINLIRLWLCNKWPLNMLHKETDLMYDNYKVVATASIVGDEALTNNELETKIEKYCNDIFQDKENK